MTLAEKLSHEYPSRSQHLALGSTFLVILVSVMIMSGLNLADPMIRHDDYPALLLTPLHFGTRLCMKDDG